jgi:hypothetical protein
LFKNTKKNAVGLGYRIFYAKLHIKIIFFQQKTYKSSTKNPIFPNALFLRQSIAVRNFATLKNKKMFSYFSNTVYHSTTKKNKITNN